MELGDTKYVYPKDDIKEYPARSSCSLQCAQTLAVAGASTLAGLGMFSEAYYMFAIGNIKTLWKTLYPTCFNHTAGSTCAVSLVSSLEFIEVAMIIVGMLAFGPIAAKFGRRVGSLSTIGLMSLGAVLLTVAYAGGALTGQFAFFAFGLGVISTGVGGEYPLASVSAAERAESTETIGEGDAIRGQSMQFTFAMQGWGNWVNTAVICLLLFMSEQGNCPSHYGANSSLVCSSAGLEFTWRYQFGLCAPILMAIGLYRFNSLAESAVWLESKKNKHKVESVHQQHSESDQEDLIIRPNKEQEPCKKSWLLVRNYWHRLLGTCSAWFLWDVAFYGNKLFQGTIITSIIGPNSTMIQVMLYTLLNSTVGLFGYYMAALTVDASWMGRWRMQNMGFLVSTILFFVCGFWYSSLQNNPQLFTFLYFLNTFFGQWGPNCTTWLLPSELFPTEIRPQAHGLSAALGKAGALVATLIFSYGGEGGGAMSADFIFYASAACSLLGLIFSVIFCSDVTSLALSETDKRWECIKSGSEYKGPAVLPQHLSIFERVVYKLLVEFRTPLFVLKNGFFFSKGH